MGTRCTRFISDDCSPGTIFSGFAGPVMRQRQQRFRHQDYGTSGKPKRGDQKDRQNFPPLKTQLTIYNRAQRATRRPYIKQGHHRTPSPTIRRRQQRPDENDIASSKGARDTRNRAATNKVGDYCTTKGASRRRTCPTHFTSQSVPSTLATIMQVRLLILSCTSKSGRQGGPWEEVVGYRQ